MTCRYSGTEWLDVLYTSVRNTPGGVADAANFLTNRRGRSISTENLRTRLRGEGDNRLSMEMFELLIEWMEEKRQPHSLEALHALNERFGLRAVPADSDAMPDTVSALALDALEVSHQNGELADTVRVAIADEVITSAEADAIASQARVSQRLLSRLIEKALRLARRH